MTKFKAELQNEPIKIIMSEISGTGITGNLVFVGLSSDQGSVILVKQVMIQQGRGIFRTRTPGSGDSVSKETSSMLRKVTFDVVNNITYVT